jgi:hypothetical protein
VLFFQGIHEFASGLTKFVVACFDAAARLLKTSLDLLELRVSGVPGAGERSGQVVALSISENPGDGLECELVLEGRVPIDLVPVDVRLDEGAWIHTWRLGGKARSREAGCSVLHGSALVPSAIVDVVEAGFGHLALPVEVDQGAGAIGRESCLRSTAYRAHGQVAVLAGALSGDGSSGQATGGDLLVSGH